MGITRKVLALTCGLFFSHGRSASERHMNRPMSGLPYSKQRHLPE